MAQVIRECEVCGDDFECDSEDSEYMCDDCFDLDIEDAEEDEE